MGVENNVDPQLNGTVINDNVCRNLTLVVKPSSGNAAISLYINGVIAASNVSTVYPSTSYTKCYICQYDGGSSLLSTIDAFSIPLGMQYFINGSITDSFGTNTLVSGLPTSWTYSSPTVNVGLYKANGVSDYYSGTLPTGYSQYMVVGVQQQEILI